MVNQVVSRVVVVVNFVVVFQFWQDVVSQLFVQFNVLLVKGEDVEDCVLGEDFVFVQGNQCFEVEWGDFMQQDGVSWVVIFEYFEWYYVFQGCWVFILIVIFLFNYFVGFIKGQGFGLGEEVRQQFLMVVRQWVVGDSWSDEIVWYYFGVLVDQLVECVLIVGVWFILDDWVSLVVYCVVVMVNIFIVGFYVVLLEVSGKVVYVLVVWQNCFGFCIEEVVVLDVDQSQQYWQVFFCWSGGEVFIYCMCVGQQFNEVVEVYGENDGQINC